MPFQRGDRVVLVANNSIKGTVLSTHTGTHADEIEVYLDTYRSHVWRFVFEIVPDVPENRECNCGFGGFHDDINPDCVMNQEIV